MELTEKKRGGRRGGDAQLKGTQDASLKPERAHAKGRMPNVTRDVPWLHP